MRNGMKKHRFHADTQTIQANGKVIPCEFDQNGELSHKTKLAIDRAEGGHSFYSGNHTFGMGRRIVCFCRYCKAQFIGKPGSYYCEGSACTLTHWTKRQKERRTSKRQFAVDMFRSYQKCKTCALPLSNASRITCKFCSDKCRQQAHRNDKTKR